MAKRAASGDAWSETAVVVMDELLATDLSSAPIPTSAIRAAKARIDADEAVGPICATIVAAVLDEVVRAMNECGAADAEPILRERKEMLLTGRRLGFSTLHTLKRQRGSGNEDVNTYLQSFAECPVSEEEAHAAEQFRPSRKRAREDDKQPIHKADEGQSAASGEAGIALPVVKKRNWAKKYKMAMVIGYCGFAYQGLQKNVGAHTIEAVMEEAIFKAGAISEDDFGHLSNIHWQRCGRTDKGVHAMRNIISLKIATEPGDMVAKINEHLPPDVRVFGMQRVTGSFSARLNCDFREYQYLVPTYALAPLPHTGIEATYDTSRGLAFPSFIISDEYKEEINALLGYFRKSHCYHNFTRGKEPFASDTVRVVEYFELQDTFICDGVEFARFVVKGQSFVYNQIRKMIGSVLATLRHRLPLDYLESAFAQEHVYVPLAPGDGLMLRRALYGNYNSRYFKDGGGARFDPWDTLVETFTMENIYPPIAQREKATSPMKEWLARSVNDMNFLQMEQINDRNSNFAHWLSLAVEAGSGACIPSSAVLEDAIGRLMSERLGGPDGGAEGIPRQPRVLLVRGAAFGFVQAQDNEEAQRLCDEMDRQALSLPEGEATLRVRRSLVWCEEFDAAKEWLRQPSLVGFNVRERVSGLMETHEMESLVHKAARSAADFNVIESVEALERESKAGFMPPMRINVSNGRQAARLATTLLSQTSFRDATVVLAMSDWDPVDPAE